MINKHHQMENGSKSISVVMTTFNGGRFLEQQIESILSQSLSPAEIIVCDDGSSDNTIEILEFYQRKALLTYFVNEARLGVIENFKKAVSLAAPGNYIALSDQDDIWFPDKLEQQYLELFKIEDGQKPAMVYSDLIVIDGQNKILNPSFWNELGQDTYRHSFKTLLFGNFVTGCTIMMNVPMRFYFSQMPANVLMHDVWLALIAFSFGKVTAIKTPLIYYRKHDSNAAFAAGHVKKDRLTRWMDNLKMILTKNDYLDNELKLLQQFLEKHETDLTKEQRKLAWRFLHLQHKPFIYKKAVFRYFFKNEWISVKRINF